MIADINNMTIEELEVAKLRYGVTLLINDGKISGIEIEKSMGGVKYGRNN